MEKAKEKQYKKLAVVQDYKDVFSSVKGQKVLNDMMAAHFVIQPTVSDNPHETYFREGQRNVVLRILQLMKVDIKEIQNRIDKADAQSRDVGTV